MHQFGYDIVCAGLIAEILSLCARYARSNENTTESRNEKLVANACEYIHNSFKTITIETLARNAYLSTGRFSRIFREVTKKSPLDYINSVKLSKAREFLENTEMPIGIVAIESGYNDGNYFCRIFRKSMGITPGEYRKAVKNYR